MLKLLPVALAAVVLAGCAEMAPQPDPAEAAALAACQGGDGAACSAVAELRAGRLAAVQAATDFAPVTMPNVLAPPPVVVAPVMLSPNPYPVGNPFSTMRQGLM